MVWHRAARREEIPVGALARFEAGGHPYLIAHVEEEGWRAADVSCTHAWAPLDRGVLQGFEVTCPLHSARFDLRDGAAVHGPARRALRTFPVRVEDEWILVDIPEGDTPPVRPGMNVGTAGGLGQSVRTPGGDSLTSRKGDSGRPGDVEH